MSLRIGWLLSRAYTCVRRQLLLYRGSFMTGPDGPTERAYRFPVHDSCQLAAD